MITVKLKGGLGNQMFQYALGRKLAVKHKTDLLLDTSRFEYNALYPNDAARQYSLDCFRLFPGARATNISQYKGGVIETAIRRITHKLIKPDHFAYDKKADHAKDGSFLEGFWQSEVYFKEIQNIIRDDFALKNPLGGNARTVLQLIENLETPVSVHVRRTDYVSNYRSVQLMGYMTDQYYVRASDAMKEKIGKTPSWVIFSDDIAWCKENMKFLDSALFVDKPDIKDYEEMALMSKCKHHIIANSTYSWWGAWLNPHKNKIVIAPKQWTADPRLDTSLVLPPEWHKL
ncbi:MAG TPA: alpha-1,2-fucosyltransferase [Candidatus Paceibacterota bacterium]|nr:alpha-1,2-fucosyltransferase [Candidatus Paceibacterota bacterium]